MYYELNLDSKVTATKFVMYFFLALLTGVGKYCHEFTFLLLLFSSTLSQVLSLTLSHHIVISTF